MKTEWNYTALAPAYLKRPDYADSAIDQLVEISGVRAGDPVCDIGAGVGHLTRMLCGRDLRVVAVEPNDAMRELGTEHTPDNVTWHEGTGEDTGQRDHRFKLVTFGSSFNVTDRQATLKEVRRILVSRGWFACMWNHRDLTDPLQAQIEDLIREEIPGYGYGTRREDQTSVIEQSGIFGPVQTIEGTVSHTQPIEEVVEAWRSHATLERQAGDRFHAIVDQIQQHLEGLGTDSIQTPYTTRIWAAQVRE